MNKTNILILVTGLAFSALFYDQLPGLNFTLFAIIFTGVMLAVNPKKARDRHWWFYAALVIVSGFCVFFVTSFISVLATFVSMAVLSGKTCAPQRSVPVAGLYTGLSLLTSPFRIVREGSAYLQNGSGTRNRKKTFVAVTVAVLAAIPFLFLYRASNPLFARFVSDIDFSWVDGGWCLFTIFSLIFLYGLLKTRTYSWLENLEEKLINDIGNHQDVESSADNLATVGLVLFTLLNIMLLLMNGLDINQLYITHNLPEGISLSTFVHEAVTATIASIIFAVSFISFFFKGELNFHSKGRTLRLLVNAWIIQTTLIVINSMVRNAWYIGEYQLTGLRIGVFVFLTLAITGLVFTWFKVAFRKSAWWLAAANAQVWFVMLVTASMINWSRLITSYNIEHVQPGKDPDISYLLEIGGNLPEMIELHRKVSFSPYQETIFRQRISKNESRLRTIQFPGYSMRMIRNHEALLQFNQIQNENEK